MCRGPLNASRSERVWTTRPVKVDQDFGVAIRERLGELARDGWRFVKEFGLDVRDEDAMC